MNIRPIINLALVVALSGLFSQTSEAFVPPPPRLDVASYILYEPNSGTVLAEYDAERRLPIASLTKIMTGYIVVDQAAQEELDINALIPISKKSAETIGSRTFLKAGSKISIQDLLKGIVIQSGNDAAVALAEHIGGSEDGFTDLMNSYTRALNMSNTLYANSTGLPSDREQYSTALDQVVLSSALIKKYPEHYDLYKEKFFTFSDIKQRNRNGLLWLDTTVDGIKTGHTSEAGYCLVSSAKRKHIRLIAVVMGAASESERNTYSRRLLEYGFRHFTTKRIFEQNEVLIQPEVWGGTSARIKLGVTEALDATLVRSDFELVDIQTHITEELVAPIQSGDVMGMVEVRIKDELYAEYPLVALERVRSRGFMGRVFAQISLFFNQLFGTK
ncbi:MAG: D-alanyl-D-alanine carboxypeptidase family protein [Gammaproteobacteria bacterium]